jgi:excisionase family DNA binding protein
MSYLDEMSEYPQVLNSQEVAKFLRLTRKTVSLMASQGRIPAKKVGSEWRFLKAKLEEWLEGYYDICEQKPVGTLSSKENTLCHYSNVATPIGSILDTKTSEYEDLLGL